jgi:hypothetical protein
MTTMTTRPTAPPTPPAIAAAWLLLGEGEGERDVDVDGAGDVHAYTAFDVVPPLMCWHVYPCAHVLRQSSTATSQ